MPFRKSASVHLLWMGLAAIAIPSGLVQAADTMYKYMKSDGSTHYSDKELPSDQYTLLETKIAPGKGPGKPRSTGIAYKYIKRDGSIHYSDRKEPAELYSLVATIGRPTATVSCKGLTESDLNARAQGHLPAIADFSRIYSVDERLIRAIIRVESCFDTRAISRVGAKGLMQLMPGTAEDMGVYNVFDANDNIRGGTRYFQLMLDRFENDMELALAAYNAGPGAVEKYKGIPPYRETQDYVKKVLKHYQKYLASTNTPG